MKGKELPAVFSLSAPTKVPRWSGSKSPVLPPISGQNEDLPDANSLPLQSIMEATNETKLKMYKSQASNKREVMFAGTESVQMVTFQPKVNPKLSREHDEYTLSCMSIEFPSCNVKTEGMPQVSQPHADHTERQFVHNYK